MHAYPNRFVPRSRLPKLSLSLLHTHKHIHTHIHIHIHKCRRTRADKDEHVCLWTDLGEVRLAREALICIGRGHRDTAEQAQGRVAAERVSLAGTPAAHVQRVGVARVFLPTRLTGQKRPASPTAQGQGHPFYPAPVAPAAPTPPHTARARRRGRTNRFRSRARPATARAAGGTPDETRGRSRSKRPSDCRGGNRRPGTPRTPACLRHPLPHPPLATA
jgi:hypothetical protein